MSNLKLEISRGRFSYILHNSEHKGSNTYGYYTYHNVDVWNNVVINGVEYLASYQSGSYYDYNDYNHPGNGLRIYGEGSNKLIDKISELEESDFDDFDNDSLDELKQLCPDIKNIDDVRKIYIFLKDNENLANEYLDSLELAEEEQ